MRECMDVVSVVIEDSRIRYVLVPSIGWLTWEEGLEKFSGTFDLSLKQSRLIPADQLPEGYDEGS